MRQIAAIVLLLVACGGQPECEQVKTLSDQGGTPYFEMTCIHECGMVLRMGYWIPGPSCEWERRVCVDRCATADGGP